MRLAASAVWWRQQRGPAEAAGSSGRCSKEGGQRADAGAPETSAAVGAGLQPEPGEWAALLRYARQDVASRAEAERGSTVAGMLREACERLREAWGDGWASQLPPSAKVRPGAVG